MTSSNQNSNGVPTMGPNYRSLVTKGAVGLGLVGITAAAIGFGAWLYGSKDSNADVTAALDRNTAALTSLEQSSQPDQNSLDYKVRTSTTDSNNTTTASNNTTTHNATTHNDSHDKTNVTYVTNNYVINDNRITIVRGPLLENVAERDTTPITPIAPVVPQITPNPANPGAEQEQGSPSEYNGIQTPHSTIPQTTPNNEPTVSDLESALDTNTQNTTSTPVVPYDPKTTQNPNTNTEQSNQLPDELVTRLIPVVGNNLQESFVDVTGERIIQSYKIVLDPNQEQTPESLYVQNGPISTTLGDNTPLTEAAHIHQYAVAIGDIVSIAMKGNERLIDSLNIPDDNYAFERSFVSAMMAQDPNAKYDENNQLLDNDANRDLANVYHTAAQQLEQTIVGATGNVVTDLDHAYTVINLLRAPIVGSVVTVDEERATPGAMFKENYRVIIQTTPQGGN